MLLGGVNTGVTGTGYVSYYLQLQYVVFLPGQPPFSSSATGGSPLGGGLSTLITGVNAGTTGKARREE